MSLDSASRGGMIGGLIFLAAAAWGFSLLGRSEDRAPLGSRCSNCNLILVSIDTLRADHLGCYGYDRGTTPSIDAFARDSVRFESVIAQAPSTLPSHASLFTSRIPSEHGASIAAHRPLAANQTTLAEVLKRRGYATWAVHDGGQMAPHFGLNQGFDRYRRGAEPGASQSGRLERNVKLATEWIRRRGRRPFFLFLHTYEVHHPYTPRPESLAAFDGGYAGPLPASISMRLLKDINEHRRVISAADRRHIVAAYDAEIREMDAGFRILLRSLRDLGVYDRAIVVLTADHGEEFGEHGWMGWHSHSLYDELLRVPLILKLPGSRLAGTVVEGQVRGIDVAPTLLALLGIPIPPAFHGVTLVPRLRGENSEIPLACSQRDVASSFLPTALRDGRWKLRNGMLVDLRQDPLERHNVASQHPALFARLAARAARLARLRTEAPTSARPDPSTREQLRQLGYQE